MKSFKVQLEDKIYYELIVEAEDEHEAEKLALVEIINNPEDHINCYDGVNVTEVEDCD